MLMNSLSEEVFVYQQCFLVSKECPPLRTPPDSQDIASDDNSGVKELP